jgi:hypothetical protein
VPLILGENNLAKESDAAIYSKNADANALYIEGLEYLSKGDARVGGSMLNAKKALELSLKQCRKTCCLPGNCRRRFQQVLRVPGIGTKKVG